MSIEEWMKWCKEDPVSMKARFVRGTVDPVVVFGVPAGSERNAFFEGVVVDSDTSMFPVGYYSRAWCSEHFEFEQGRLSYTPQ